jgi:hypothetical protein
MRLVVAILILCLVGVTGCRGTETAANLTPASSPAPRASAAPVKSRIDVCNLLTSDELKAVQGEAYKDAQRSDRLDGEFVIAQCYYAMPTTVNSVVVNVTTAKEDAGAKKPKDLWEQTFGGDEDKPREGQGERGREDERGRGKEKEKAREPRERGEEGEAKEASPPERVKDLGTEAFWVGSPIGGALYVLKNDLFFRISIGGAGDPKAKLNKSKTLAQAILKKL